MLSNLKSAWMLMGWLLLSCGVVRADEPVIVRVTAQQPTAIVGEWISEDSRQIELLDLKTNQVMRITKTLTTKIDKPYPLNDAARTVGLPILASHLISRLSAQQNPTGKVAKVTSQAVYISLGESSGWTVGQKLTVYRNDGDVIDPDTGAVLASERTRITDVEVTEVSEKISKAKLLDNAEVALAIGDLVEAADKQLVVAVCPPANDDGTASPTGSGLAEELTGLLVQRKVTVVERSALDEVLKELFMQSTALFDEAQAQRLGKLTGASVVLTGKIVTDKATATGHLRLVDVTTGKILLAVSAPVKVRNLTDGSSTTTSGDGQKWTVLFPPKVKQAEPFPNLGNLAFGDVLFAATEKTFTVNGSFAMNGNQYALATGQQAAITLLAGVKDFEMEGKIDVGDVGGMFLLVGWKDGNGTLIQYITHRKSNTWSTQHLNQHKLVDGTSIGLGGNRLLGIQPVFMKVANSKLSLTVGPVKLMQDYPLANGEGGDVILGTYATQYGPKKVAIQSLRWR